MNWTLLDCPECSGRFKAPGNLAVGDSVACPACGAMVGGDDGEEAEKAGGGPEPAAEFDIDLGDTAPPAARSSTGSLPPPPKKSINFEMPELVIREANERFRARAETEGDTDEPPSPVDVSRISSTSDEAFVPEGPEAPKERSMRSRDREAIIGWDEDVDHGDPEAGDRQLKAKRQSKAQVALTLKLLLCAVPLVIGLALVAKKLNSQKLTGGEELRMGIDDAAAGPAEAQAEEEEVPMEPIRKLLNEHGHDEFYRRCKAAIVSFLEAPDLESRLKTIRDADRVRPLMEDFYSRNPDGPTEYAGISKPEKSSLAKGVAVLQVILPDFEELPIVVAVEDGDRLVVDWESFVGYCEMSFEDFIETKPTEPQLFRVRARPSDYYNFDFDDSSTHYCMQMEDLQFKHSFFGYMRKDSEVASKIFTELTTGGIDFIVVKLRYPERPRTDNQVIIDDFICRGWLIR